MSDPTFRDLLPPDPDGAHESFVAVAPLPAEVAQVWRDYWAPLFRQGGMGRLKGELYDYWRLVNEARLVYRHITGGLTDDLCASADGIIALADRRVARLLEDVRAELAAAEREIDRLRAEKDQMQKSAKPQPEV